MAGRRNYYEVLGVGMHAGADEIRVAFRRLARERHPDRFQGSAKRDAETEFQAITEAYNILSDTEQRRRYDQSLAGSGPQELTSPREVARALLAKAVSLMKVGDHVRADQFFAQAIAHDPQNAKAFHLYGMFLAQQAGRVEDALRRLDQALKLDPLNVRMMLDASRLFARARMFARATRLAESALELSPGDETVESWLHQLRQMSRGEGAR